MSKYFISLILLLSVLSVGGCNNMGSEGQPIPDEIRAIFKKPLYDGAIWALRVVDVETGEVVYNQRSDDKLFIASVRKVFTTAQALDALGQGHMFRTPIHRQGSIDTQGVLNGDLILLATGDFTMGGRRLPNNTMDIVDFDHNEADIFGNAELTTPNPLQGYKNLAKQIAGSGVKRITGEIIIDDRLFEPYFFRGQYDIRSIFVNDDVVDVIIDPGEPGEPAIVDWRPKSAAFDVESSVETLASGMVNTVEVAPLLPECFGMEGCKGEVLGEISPDVIPPLTQEFPIVQTFRITDPSSYARSVLIEALIEEGVQVDAPVIGKNPSQLLPLQNSYTADTILAELVSLPFSQYQKLVLKVSYNIGSETSLLLWGLTQGVDNMDDTLLAERNNLIQNIGIPGEDFSFVDGSGGGETQATAKALIQILEYIKKQPFFPNYLQLLPILGVDGTLSFVTDFEADPTLAGAKANVFAKTGTFAEGDETGIVIRGRALSGYIDTKSGRRLMFGMIVNNVPIGQDIQGLFTVSQDQGTISAIIWRDN